MFYKKVDFRHNVAFIYIYIYIYITVTYMKNCAYLLLVSIAICINVQNLSCTQIMSLQAKLNGFANSVVKSVTDWLAWRVTYKHIEFKGGLGEDREDMRQRMWSRSEPRGEPSYIYIYIVFYIEAKYFVTAVIYILSDDCMILWKL